MNDCRLVFGANDSIKEGVILTNQVMQNFLYKRFLTTPDRVAFHYKGRDYSFADVYHESYKIAGQLTANGMKKGQFTGVLLKNNLETVFILFALQLIGVRAVILNNRLTSGEIGWQLQDSKAKFLITENAFDKVQTNIKYEFNDIITLFKETLAGKTNEPELVKEIALDDICTIMYTSGTTGHPKGVMQTYGNHLWSAIGSSLNLGLNDRDAWLCTVPLFHISGFSILMRSIIYGMKVVLIDAFDERAVIQLIHKEKVTIMSAVSTMLTKMLDDLDGESLPEAFRCLLLGGGPASRSLLEVCKQNGIPVYQTYGMTETSSQIVTLSPEDSLAKLGSAGKALFPSQLKVMNESGTEAVPNEPGEILVKGPNVTSGYLGHEEITAEKINDGWLSTGDIGYIDEDGFLFVLDRRSDLIISGGENIYPAEVEGILNSHPGVSDAGVIGMKDVTWGEVPVAFVVIKKNHDTCHDELESFCNEKLAKYKIPKRFFIVDEIPRNASKKILRRELRKMIHM
ncbi:o-succinylbenzoate--CoA ligase [Cytobacillus purgationiresistens]|uniref:2-succinylbenzoate--CoA ligase n=1 Tax=Cytobacillus purgationiresistens TaxID=863449 RepID=A0ABU0AST3_9BACI|nr:o-succinylbenzoate--CoA ligase [Cytobacillus purgationiresistens]MDQ0273832.1 O-succinylbenzoic acid--CoA ligase [Cytobacillus purgationiresistens]